MDIFAGAFLKRLDTMIESLPSELASIGTQTAYELEQRAKKSAPWRDRTGNARRTLTASCVLEGGVLKVGIAGMMKYSPELELGYERRYSVLLPIVREGYSLLLQLMFNDKQ